MSRPPESDPPSTTERSADQTNASSRLTSGAWLRRASDLARADLEHLLLARLQISRSQLMLDAHRPLPARLLPQLASDCARLRDGEPLAYVLGSAAFRALTLTVDARVLVPRPETELLVAAALAQLDRLAELRAQAGPAALEPLAALDLGTGSGAIAIALQSEAHLPVQLTATDASTQALAVARANAAAYGAAIEFIRCDWFTALDSTYDLIVSNPPYIAAGDTHLPALQHEPTAALVAGNDGLSALRNIIGNAPGYLKPHGALLVEHGWDQGPAVQSLFASAGFTAVRTERDYSGNPRLTLGIATLRGTP